MAFTPYSAKNAKVRFGAGGSTLTVKSWSVNPTNDIIETTNSEGGGYYEGIAGISKLEITIEGDDDATVNLFTAGWTAGATISSLKLYLSGTSGPYWSISSFLVQSVPQKADVKSSVGNTFTGVGTGSFSYPSGTIS